MTRQDHPIVLDGVLQDGDTVPIHVLGGAFQCGEGLFETLPCIAGEAWFLHRHVLRLSTASRELGLLPVAPEEEWRRDVEILAAACGGRDLAVRLFCFRDADRVRRVVAGMPMPADADAPARLGLAAPRFQGPRVLAHLKTLNYLVPRLALREGEARGNDEVLFTLPDGTVLEGSRSTVFVVLDGVARTTPLELPILPGVTREVLLELAREARAPIREERFSVSDVERADEVFLTSSLRGVRPVRRTPGGRHLAQEGPVTLFLARLYESARPGR